MPGEVTGRGIREGWVTTIGRNRITIAIVLGRARCVRSHCSLRRRISRTLYRNFPHGHCTSSLRCYSMDKREEVKCSPSSDESVKSKQGRGHVAGFSRNGWQFSSGIGGSFHRNGWQVWAGIHSPPLHGRVIPHESFLPPLHGWELISKPTSCFGVLWLVSGQLSVGRGLGNGRP